VRRLLESANLHIPAVFHSLVSISVGAACLVYCNHSLELVPLSTNIFLHNQDLYTVHTTSISART